MGGVEGIKRVLRVFLQLLFPHKCFLCGKVLADSGLLCNECELPSIGENEICHTCGKIYTDCMCKKGLEICKGVTAPLYYIDGAVNGIRRFKYDGCIYYSIFLADLMAFRVAEDFNGIEFDFVTYVPMHIKKRKQRGFCPAELLAKKICEILSLPIRADILMNTGKGGVQMKQKSEKARIENAEMAFAKLPGAILDGETTLLVDDVLTTGATLRRCAILLTEIGAGAVYAVTAATTKGK